MGKNSKEGLRDTAVDVKGLLGEAPTVLELSQVIALIDTCPAAVPYRKSRTLQRAPGNRDDSTVAADGPLRWRSPHLTWGCREELAAVMGAARPA